MVITSRVIKRVLRLVVVIMRKAARDPMAAPTVSEEEIRPWY
jgi:hypothetical protein